MKALRLLLMLASFASLAGCSNREPSRMEENSSLAIKDEKLTIFHEDKTEESLTNDNVNMRFGPVGVVEVEDSSLHPIDNLVLIAKIPASTINIVIVRDLDRGLGFMIYANAVKKYFFPASGACSAINIKYSRSTGMIALSCSASCTELVRF